MSDETLSSLPCTASHRKRQISARFHFTHATEAQQTCPLSPAPSSPSSSRASPGALHPSRAPGARPVVSIVPSARSGPPSLAISGSAHFLARLPPGGTEPSGARIRPPGARGRSRMGWWTMRRPLSIHRCFLGFESSLVSPGTIWCPKKRRTHVQGCFSFVDLPIHFPTSNTASPHHTLLKGLWLQLKGLQRSSSGGASPNHMIGRAAAIAAAKSSLRRSGEAASDASLRAVPRKRDTGLPPLSLGRTSQVFAFGEVLECGRMRVGTRSIFLPLPLPIASLSPSLSVQHKQSSCLPLPRTCACEVSIWARTRCTHFCWINYNL